MLIVWKALDAEQVPRPKRVEQEALPDAFPPRPDAQRLRGVPAEGEGEHGAALGNVDVVDVGTLLRGPLVEALPGGGLEGGADDGVVLEDEEEGALAEVAEGVAWALS